MVAREGRVRPGWPGRGYRVAVNKKTVETRRGDDNFRLIAYDQFLWLHLSANLHCYA